MYITPINICRTLLAISTLCSLFFNSNYVLFGDYPNSSFSFKAYTFFYLFSDNLILAKIIAVSILVLVISGLYPRITSVLHWYITFSFFIACDIIDGGDVIASNITFLLIPIYICDPRKNHFHRKIEALNQRMQNLEWFFYAAILIQISLIYFNAFASKIKYEDWRSGYSAYYHISHNLHGIDISQDFHGFLTRNVIVIKTVTWGTLLIEFLIAIVVVFKSNLRTKVLHRILIFCTLFHLSIMLVHGLFTFFLVMCAALVIYVLPKNWVYHKNWTFN